jgi:signal transduction histidine kinase
MNGGSREARQNMDESVIKELMDGFVHEVKNPLTSIKVALKVLRKKIAPEDPDRKVIEQVSDQIGNINKALSDLMDFTRISSPEASLTDIEKVLEQSLDRIQSECQRREIKVEKHLSGSLPEVTIDARQIEQAFLLLFLDMVKAMPEGGKLMVRGSWDSEGHILLKFEDTGVPVPEAHLERLFKPFLSTMGRGSGTGLSIARRILEQNGGSIQAKKGGEKGLAFRIVFPIPP